VDGFGARALARRRGSGPSVYFEVDRAPYAAGPASFIGEMLTRLGTRNIVDADLGPFPKLNPEYVVRHNPDVIFVSPTDEPHLAERPGWDQIRAVKEHRLCVFAAGVNNTIVRPGPRVAEGMGAIEECLERVSP
jgi:iron complex transport system substrate-binding protein